MLYSFGELEGIQMMHACVRNSWMLHPYWQKTKKALSNHGYIVSVQCTTMSIF